MSENKIAADYCVANNDNPTDCIEKILVKCDEEERDYIVGLKLYSLIKAGKSEEYDKLFSKLKDEHYNSPFALLCSSLIEGEESKKEALLIEAHKIDKSNVWVLLELYDFYLDLDYPKAEMYLENVFEIYPDFTPSLVIRAFQLDETEHCADIIDILLKVIPNYTNDEIEALMGSAYDKCGNHDMALLHFNNSLNIKPSVGVHIYLGYIYSHVKKDYDKAHKHFQLAIETDPNDVEALFTLGWFYHDRGDRIKAEDYLIKALEKGYTQDAYNQFVLYSIAIGKVEQALAWIEQAEHNNGNNFFNDGLRLIVSYLRQEVSLDYESSEVKDYQNKYGQEGLDWMYYTLKYLELPKQHSE